MVRAVFADPDVASRLAVAAVCGAAVGVERQWSGHATGPTAHFAGVRTFTLLGFLGGFAGWLWSTDRTLPAIVLLGTAGALVVAAYIAVSRRDVDGTSESAALVVLAAGFAAGLGALALASAIVAVTTLLLVEKSQLHRLVTRIADEELRAGARFAVMAVVVLPLLPAGPFGPLGGVRPRALWALVLLFSGLSFAGWVARRVVGERRGYAVTGAIAGLVSSTAATFALARASTDSPGAARALATGVVAASTVMFARLAATAAILEPALARASLRYVLLPLVVGAIVTAALFHRARARPRSPLPTRGNPLQLGAALQMALLFQVVLFAVEGVRGRWGDVGLVPSGAILGLTDVDALTIAMATSVRGGAAAATGAAALAVGALSNTILKAGIVVALGAPGFRGTALLGLGLLALALAAGVAW